MAHQRESLGKSSYDDIINPWVYSCEQVHVHFDINYYDSYPSDLISGGL